MVTIMYIHSVESHRYTANIIMSLSCSDGTVKLDENPLGLDDLFGSICNVSCHLGVPTRVQFLTTASHGCLQMYFSMLQNLRRCSDGSDGIMPHVLKC